MKPHKQIKRAGLGCGGLIILVFVIAAIAGSTHKSGNTSTTSSTGTTSTAQVAHVKARTTSVHQRSTSPCSRITRSADTSCAFAGAVKRVYLEHPNGTEVVYSPVTQQTYSMRCLQARGVVACSGGVRDSAQVAFKGPSGPGTAAPTSTATVSNTESTSSSGNTGGASAGTTGGSGNAACQPLTDGGNCYEPGEYCRDTDHGVSGVAGDGETITCEDNDGWRWEPS